MKDFFCHYVCMLFWTHKFSTNGPKSYMARFFWGFELNSLLSCCLYLWLDFVGLNYFSEKVLLNLTWFIKADNSSFCPVDMKDFLTKPWGIVIMFAAILYSSWSDLLLVWRKWHFVKELSFFLLQICIFSSYNAPLCLFVYSGRVSQYL